MSKKNTKNKLKKNIQSKKTKSLSFFRQTELLKIIGGIIVITFLVFFSALFAEFVNWDDSVNIYENPHLESFDLQSIKNIFTSTVIGGYNPLSIFSFAVEKAIFGESSQVIHFNNLILHLICVFLVFRIMLLLKLSPWAAGIVALLFGIHPMRVESVAWATERKDVLFGAFYFASMFYYILYIQAEKIKKRKLYIISIVLFILSLFSKIQAVSLPLTLLALDFYLKRDFNKSVILEKVPYFILSLIIGLLGISFLTESNVITNSDSFTFIERLAIGSYSFWIYIMKFIFPYEMSPLYPYPSSISSIYFLSFIPSVLLMFSLFYFYKNKNRIILFGILFFIFNVIFVLQIVGAGQGFKADRFTYVGYTGLFFLLAYGCSYLIENNKISKNILNGILALYFVLCFFLTSKQINVWKNNETLWTHVMELFPEVSTAYLNLGNYYRDDKKDYNKALEIYQKGMSTTSVDAQFYNSIGKLYFDKGDMNNALQNLNQSVAYLSKTKLKNDKIAEIYLNRGATFSMLNQYDNAIQDFNKAIELYPENPKCYSDRGLLNIKSGQYEAAIKDYDEYLKIIIVNSDIWHERGVSHRELGNYEQAIKDISKAIQLKNNDGNYYLNRCEAYLRMQNIQEAKNDLENAKRYGASIPSHLIEQLK